MGQAADAWAKIRSMMETNNFDDVTEVYGADTLFLEPYNPPHRGNLLTQAYMKDYFSGKTNVAVDEVRNIEAADGNSIAIEWTLSYDAAGRRWNALPRATFIELDADGLVENHRDYS